MAAYVVFIQDRTKKLPEGDIAAGMAKYNAQAQQAPSDKIEMLVSKTGKFEMLEGAPAEAVVIMRFPTMNDALTWYNSDAYQKSIPHRTAVRDYRVFVAEGD